MGRNTSEAYLDSRNEEKHVKEVDFVEMNIVPELLNWTKATERLIKYGLAGDLADQLSKNRDIKQNWDTRFRDLNLIANSLPLQLYK